MRLRAWLVCAAGLLGSAACTALAAEAAAPIAGLTEPLYLATQPELETVYAPPAPPKPEDGVNLGAVSLDLKARYLSDYVYRGIDYTRVSSTRSALNLQIEGRMSLDLGSYPHPFVGLFSNTYDKDPVSRFQEIRPTVGLDWNLRPFLLEAGHNSYIYPERERLFNTAEAYGKITIDDSYFTKRARPLLSPYVMGAWDYDLNHGWYLEAGVKHDFVFDDFGLVLTVLADVAYISHIRQQFIFPLGEDYGFQHYDVGLVVNFSLNHLLSLSSRYGQYSVEGTLMYTDGLKDRVGADTKLYGGTGISFHY